MAFGKKKEMLTARIPRELKKELDAIAKFNGKDRTEQLKKYLEEGIKKSKEALNSRYVAFSIMILTLAAAGLYMWLMV